MADKFGEAKLILTVDAAQMQTALDAINKQSDATAEHVRGISELLHTEAFVEFGKQAFEALSRVAEGIMAMGERGTAIQEVSNGFEGLALGVHSTADVMLGALREGTQNTIANFDLMKMGAKILGTGVVQTGDQMQTLAAGAKMLSERTGTDLKEAFETLTGAMVTGRTNGLKHLGLMVDSKAATMAFAEAHGKTVKELTDAEKATAVSAATLAVLRKQLGDGAEGALKFGELVAQAKASFQNFTDQISLGIAKSPVLLAGMNAAGAAISAAFGPQQKGIIAAVISVVEKLAIGVGYVAEFAVDAGKVLVTAWMVAKVAFNEYLTFMTGGLGIIISGFASVAEAMAKVSGSKAMADVAAGIRDAATYTKALSAGFEKNAADAMVSADEQTAALDKVKGVIHTVTAAMEAAEGKAVSTSAGTVKAIAGIGDSMEHVGQRTHEAAVKIADELMKLNQAIALGRKEGLDKQLQQIENEKEAELAKVRELKGLTAAEYAQMATLIGQKYAQMAVAAKAGADKIRDTHRKLENDIVLFTKTGTEKRLAEIEVARQDELASLEYLKANYTAQYTAMTALVQQKYTLMANAAKGQFTTVQQAAAAAGFKTRAELQDTAATALRTYNEMKESNKFTTAEMQKAWEDMEKKKQEATASGATFQKVTLADLATAASSFLTTVFGKSKAAAIAAAIIDLAAAVIKTFRTFGWPAGIPMAAMMTAAGLAQIAKIKSQSFSTGTANLDYQSFGRVAPAFLHGNEAVIPQGGGHKLAGEIAQSMKKTPSDGKMLRHMARQTDALEMLVRHARLQRQTA